MQSHKYSLEDNFILQCCKPSDGEPSAFFDFLESLGWVALGLWHQLLKFRRNGFSLICLSICVLSCMYILFYDKNESSTYKPNLQYKVRYDLVCLGLAGYHWLVFRSALFPVTNFPDENMKACSLEGVHLESQPAGGRAFSS